MILAGLLRNGIVLTVGVLILLVLGILAALRIPVQMIPDLEVRTISVRTTWPGATPQDVEKEILIEQEEYLRNIPNLQRLEATASSGQAQIELDFPFGVDMTDTLIRVNNALNQVPSYPLTTNEPQVFTSSFSANAFMFFRVSPLPGNPRQLDLDLLSDFVEDNVRPRMSSVPGVSEVQVRGGAERQIQVLIDPIALANRRLTIADVRTAIQARNRDVSAGEIDSGKRRYLLRTVGRFSQLADLRDTIIAQRADALIRLSDVAEVRLDHFENRTLAYLNGEPMINLSVRREAGSNVIDIKEQMLETVAAINTELMAPMGLEIDLIADDVVYVQDSIRNVWTNLMIGALFATLVMYLFLRSVRVTAIGVAGIPICTIAGFIGLLIAERTINVISLAGIAFAIGMTLDNSIVALESIALERSRGRSKAEAAMAGVAAIWSAVLAATLTTILVFTPILFVQEEAGQLYSDIAIAISVSILASMLVAVTLVPAACAHFSLGDELSSAAHSQSNRQSWWLKRIEWLLATGKRRWSTVGAVFGGSLLVIVLFMPPAEYLPEGEEPKVFARMNAPPGYNLATMEEISLQIRDKFLPYVNDVANQPATDAAMPPLRYINLRVEPNGMRIITEPVNRSDVDAVMQVLEAEFSQYPGMRAFVSRGSIITSNDGGTRSINLDISGPSLQTILATAQACYDKAREVFGNPRIQTNPSSLTLGQPLVEVRPDWERLQELGMSTADLGVAVAALTDGAFADEFFQDDDKIDIYLYGPAGPDSTLDALRDLPVYTPAGSVLPLAALADIRETADTGTVRRVNGRRTVTLNIIPPDDVPLETGVALVRDEVLGKLQAAGSIPSSVGIEISGASDQLDATRDALFGNYLVALVIIYLLLVAILRHWGYPLLIMTTIPLGIGGGILGLALLNGFGGLLPLVGMSEVNQPFDMISMLGFLILMGTVVNNPILIVDRAVRNTVAGAMPPLEAVSEAVQVRFRPIIISTFTTIFGLTPLVLLPGAGTELYRGVGAIVMFGILTAAVVTLTMLPALLVIVLQWRQASTAR